MSIEINGRLTKKLAIESGTSKANKEWRKGGFVIDTGAQYNPEVAFSCFGDEKIEMLSKFKEGQEVKVSFNVSSREYNGKYFHNLDAWKIDLIGSSNENVEKLKEVMDLEPSDDEDSLPF